MDGWVGWVLIFDALEVRIDCFKMVQQSNKLVKHTFSKFGVVIAKAVQARFEKERIDYILVILWTNENLPTWVHCKSVLENTVRLFRNLPIFLDQEVSYLSFNLKRTLIICTKTLECI